MKKMMLIATLAVAAIPVFSQGQLKPITTPAITRQPPSPQLQASTGFGDSVIAHVADGAGWQTTITVVNLRPTPTTFSINCYGDNGGAQTFSWAGVGVFSGVYGSLAGFGSSDAVTTGTASTTSVGWCNWHRQV